MVWSIDWLLSELIRQSFHIRIKASEKQTIFLNCGDDDRAIVIKNLLKSYLGVPPERQKLFLADKVTEILDPQTLQDVRVGFGGVVYVKIKPEGTISSACGGLDTVIQAMKLISARIWRMEFSSGLENLLFSPTNAGTVDKDVEIEY